MLHWKASRDKLREEKREEKNGKEYTVIIKEEREREREREREILTSFARVRFQARKTFFLKMAVILCSLLAQIFFSYFISYTCLMF